ncbi:MAG: glyoxalase superfamily protein [Pseudomonadales bacterium]|nr:glyoxalase superfamily protein [Pseudomonadales bacterium]HJN51996.1 glyoxalase superfamily protein [Pseudomonadales bacterium]
MFLIFWTRFKRKLSAVLQGGDPASVEELQVGQHAEPWTGCQFHETDANDGNMWRIEDQRKLSRAFRIQNDQHHQFVGKRGNHMGKPSIATQQITPVLKVSDVSKSIDFYVDVLGFSTEFTFGDDYAGVKMGDLIIHLNAAPASSDRIGKGSVYIFCRDGVDEYYRMVVDNGVDISSDPPKEYEYGMKDFRLSDPDGNWLTFGQEVG